MRVHASTLILFLACLFLLPSAHAEPPAPPATSKPLSEFEPVIAEIGAMIKTDTSQVPNFVVREATPERIEKLFRMPEVVQLPRNVRENGLIFAGLGAALLSFDKPSDIIAKISAWFPLEVAQARAGKDAMFFGYVHLWGPYAHWHLEPAVFLSLWNCMPQNAWLKPEQNPFMRRLNDRVPLYPIAAKQSSYEEFDFGFCIHQRSGYQPSWQAEDIPKNQQRLQQMGERVTPLLRSKFAAFLNASRCRGTGPDDCVLILRLWASLLPSDPELAAHIRDLEADVAPDAPLPDLINPKASWFDSRLEDGQARFDLGLRRAAFLRAKLLSVLNAPNAWPGDALAITLRQLSTLRQDFSVPFVKRWNIYEIDYRNDPVNPWRVFEMEYPEKDVVRLALLDELERLSPGNDAECEVHEQWFRHGGPYLQTEHVLRRLRSPEQGAARCGAPDFDWLRQQAQTDYRHVLYGYLALMDSLPETERKILATGLTQDGVLCRSKKEIESKGWLGKLCAKERSEKRLLPGRTRS